ncbi:centrosomal protein of 76 kda [Anaeramoeba ignava]|uniref:Centrosomal protein of 76 kDa n=1 Tax=Anaeramoeba ignava TaxID=1746090 RepID=A0A9Q0RBM0_ANAIG|nr:centrosomal protein of 76 kda [Anaeramoeba ignava]
MAESNSELSLDEKSDGKEIEMDNDNNENKDQINNDQPHETTHDQSLINSDKKDKDKDKKDKDKNENEELSQTVKLIENPEQIRHKFKLRIDKITFRGCQIDNPRLRFILGGNFKIVDKRHLGGQIEKTGKLGKKFTTGKSPNYNGGSGSFSNTFTTKRKFSYQELKEQNLTIELFDKSCCGFKSKNHGDVKINLEKLANGNIQQTVKTEIHEKNSHKTTCEISFLCYFQEIFTFNLHFYCWRGRNLIAADSDGTSDPYVHMKISKTFSNFFKKGGVFGRKCSSKPDFNTLQPYWDDVGRVSYYGIRSELENEDLICTVYDWNRIEKDKVIGHSEIEMRGFADTGVLQGALYLKTGEQEGETNPSNVKDAGYIDGLVECEDIPPHCQYGDIIMLKPGRPYLAVEVLRGSNLNSTDANGFTDAYVVVEWDGFRQRTKVVERSLNPQFMETLYFPVKLPFMSEAGLVKKGSIKITVLDQDEKGDDFLGVAYISLKSIAHGVTEKYDPHDGTNVQKETRVYTASLQLVFNGELTEQYLETRSWFQPALPNDFKLENADLFGIKTPLEEKYRKREQEWKKFIPKTHLEAVEYPISGTDENFCEHFIPTYMQPILLPHELRDKQEIIRTVKCIPFENDEETFNGRDDVWCSPNFFLDLKKGSAEEHAMLIVNMLLGLGLKAYFCYGKTYSGDPHTWVMTLASNGSVSFYETSTGKEYVLKDQWGGYKDSEQSLYDALATDTDLDQPKKPLSKQNDELELDSDVDEPVKKKIQTNTNLPEIEVLTENREKLPYMNLSIVSDNTNLWANIQPSLDPCKIDYDLSDRSKWLPFIESVDEEVKPFAEPSRIRPKVPAGRIDLMAYQLQSEIVAAYKNWRHGNHMRTYFHPKLPGVMKHLLYYYEMQALGKLDSSGHKDLLIWKGKLTAAAPVGYSFVGVPLNFNYTDNKKIIKFLFEKFDYHTEVNPDVCFACSVYIKSYFNSVCSVWVFIAKMVPKPKEKKKEETKKEETKKKTKTITIIITIIITITITIKMIKMIMMMNLNWI